jgi:acetyltransferase-like isoleucine patch superfamily enzyme
MNLPPWNELSNETILTLNNFNIFRGKEFVTIGKDVWIGYYTLIDGSGGLKIGNKVSISSGVHIYTHDSSKFRAYDLQKDPINGSHIKRAPVKIGNNVQIGANSIITKGVTIGNNVIIGALTLVNKDIPDNSFVTGNPMVIKKLNNDYK